MCYVYLICNLKVQLWPILLGLILNCLRYTAKQRGIIPEHSVIHLVYKN